MEDAGCREVVANGVKKAWDDLDGIRILSVRFSLSSPEYDTLLMRAGLSYSPVEFAVDKYHYYGEHCLHCCTLEC